MTGGTRKLDRRTLLAVGGLSALSAATGLLSPGEAAAAPAAAMRDDFSGLSNRPLDGRVAPTGHRWSAYGDGASSPMVVYNRAMGPPAGHVPGAAIRQPDGNPSAAAGYASVDMGGPVGQVHAALRWDRSNAVSTGLAFGAFDFVPGTIDPGPVGGSSAHVGVTPRWVQFSVFSMGVFGDYETLVPRGGTSTTTYLRYPHRCDGSSVYRAYVTISGTYARIDMDGLAAPLEFTDPRIASVRASTAFWEYYSLPGGTNLPRVVRVSASRQ